MYFFYEQHIIKNYVVFSARKILNTYIDDQFVRCIYDSHTVTLILNNIDKIRHMYASLIFNMYYIWFDEYMYYYSMGIKELTRS